MLSENIKNIRKSKGLSQEELAIKLNVVRQTVSKWEKGISLPDSEMLIKISTALETPVNVLLDETISPDESSELKIIANKLEILNEQIAKHNESHRKMRKVLFIVLCVIATRFFVRNLVNFIYLQLAISSIGIIGGADGPTAIFVTSTGAKPLIFVILLAVAVISAIGIYKNRKK